MPKRILQGVVTSNQNEQTVTVSVERRFKHPLLHKTVRKSKKYRAHDEAQRPSTTGDMVRIRGMCAEIENQTLGRFWSTRRPEALNSGSIETLGLKRSPPKVGRNLNDPDADQPGCC